ncbi:hypothetical protein VCHA40O237_290021 [Vibrio chagasii]|nr:hypothetical protein VCHA40O237_290021 [Vibrio chagasii]CAH7177785.1 hypothetical protein VCHA48P437_280022 [Vibrio chagasii]CAH7243050.1 hypothetical protein VCHA44O286_310019 [Vibrio chagasii]CAH7377698.1 hypothetical protein VCHA55O508_290022 [Vibrio chagasii]
MLLVPHSILVWGAFYCLVCIPLFEPNLGERTSGNFISNK